MLHNFLQACVHKTHACGVTIFDQQICERYDQVDGSPCPNGIDFDFIQPDKHEIQLGGRQQNLSLCQISGTQCQFFTLQTSAIYQSESVTCATKRRDLAQLLPLTSCMS